MCEVDPAFEHETEFDVMVMLLKLRTKEWQSNRAHEELFSIVSLQYWLIRYACQTPSRFTYTPSRGIANGAHRGTHAKISLIDTISTLSLSRVHAKTLHTLLLWCHFCSFRGSLLFTCTFLTWVCHLVFQHLDEAVEAKGDEGASARTDPCKVNVSETIKTAKRRLKTYSRSSVLSPRHRR